MTSIKTYFYLGPKGAKQAAENGASVVIVVDALRATSSIVTLFMQGIEAIKPLTDINTWDGFRIGEFQGKIIPGCALNNSPHTIRQATIKEKVVGLQSTNGTACILNAKTPANHVLIGSALNAKACAQQACRLALQTQSEIHFILAGRRGKMADEDHYVASLIHHHLSHQTKCKSIIQPRFVTNLLQAIQSTPAATRLINLGTEPDIALCAKENITQYVPKYENTWIRLAQW